MKLLITVKPGSRQEKVEKTENGYVVYVKEPPMEGKANKALIQLLSHHFEVSKSHITILSGMKSKKKIVEIRDLGLEGLNK